MAKGNVKKKQQQHTDSRAAVYAAGFFLLMGLLTGSALFMDEPGGTMAFVAKCELYLLGEGSFLLPLACFLLSWKLFVEGKLTLWQKKTLAIFLVMLCLLGTAHHVFVPMGEELKPQLLPEGGGLVGALIVLPLHRYLGGIGSLLALVLGWLCAFGLLFPVGIIANWLRDLVADITDKTDEELEKALEQEEETVPKGAKNIFKPISFGQAQGTVGDTISEHIKFAGVHSGDATIQFPPQKLYVETMRRIKRISRQIAKELEISGPFNIQFLARENEIKVIECNLRASRSFPFVSKVLKINFIELATQVMLGLDVQKPDRNLFDLDYVGIKASQFSFNRLQKADPVLGVDMASTGEVGCIGEDTSCAVLKSMLSVGYRIPEKHILMSTGNAKQKAETLEAAKLLVAKGYRLYATGGSHKYLADNGVESTLVYWPSEEGQPQALEMLHERKIDMVINIPKDLTAGELDNGYRIRRAAIDLNIPLITNAKLATAFITAFCTMTPDDIAIRSWQEY